MNTDALIRANRRRVLVVEDEVINRELLGFILRDQYDVLYAENGQAALDVLRANPGLVSMVLLDINMPVMNGLELLRIMKADERLRQMPVIVLTSDRGSEVETLKLGALDFIKKPYDMPEIILARVERIIQFSEDKKIIDDVEHDALTGLYNRGFFHEYAERLLTAFPDRQMDMIAVDIDRFRMVNEVYGKKYGDEVLLAVADAIRDVLRASYGISCRCEADLFYIFAVHREDYGELYMALSHRVHALGEQNNIRLRMGVYANVGAERGIEWYSDAAKSACGSIRGNFSQSVSVYDAEMYKRELYQERLIADMEQAFREHQFRVFYQPKYDVTGDTPRLCSAEALVRWIHPELGFISPGDFIPLFEENGLITRLDDYIWREAASMIKEWERRHGHTVPVSVNLSRMDLFDPTLKSRLLSILDEYDIPQDHLLLEVTESAYTESIDQMLETVAELRRIGFKVEMDDFGSGYSSLNMLCVMPIDTIKIDMKFVQNLTGVDAQADRAAPSVNLDDASMGFHMLELVIDIAHNLRVPAIIEGVETAEQYAMVKRAGCDIVQGYYFSRPVDADAFERILCAGEIPEKWQATSVLHLHEISFSSLAQALSVGFESIYYVDIESGRYIEYRSFGRYTDLKIERRGETFFEDTRENIKTVVFKEDQPVVTAAFDRDTLLRAIEGGRIFTMTYRLVIDGEPAFYNVKAVRTTGADTRHIVIGVSNVDDQMRLQRMYEDAQAQKLAFSSIARALSNDYETVYYVDVETDAYSEYVGSSRGGDLRIELTGERFFDDVQRDLERKVYAGDRRKVAAAFQKAALLDRLDRDEALELTYRLTDDGPSRCHRARAAWANADRRHVIIGVSGANAPEAEPVAAEPAREAVDAHALIAEALAKDYFSVYYVDAATGEFVEYRSDAQLHSLRPVRGGADFFEECRAAIGRAVHPEDREQALDIWRKERLLPELEGGRAFSAILRAMIGGEPVYVNCKAVRVDEAEGGGHIAVGVSNVDAQVRREQANAQARGGAAAAAGRDALTGVKSRHAFVEDQKALNARLLSGEHVEFSVVVCDVNGLKAVNDALGHKAGDRHIREASAVICEIFKHSPVYRIGGDEFAVIMRGQDHERRDALMGTMRRVVERNRQSGGVVIASGISSYAPQLDNNVEAVFERADALMYENKKQLKAR